MIGLLCGAICAEAAVRTWDGGGSDDRWTTPANWLDDVAPEPGDAIIFPNVVSRSTAFNDFPPGTTFHDITVRSEMVIHGNQVALNAGLRILDDLELTLGIRLNSPQTIFMDDDSFSARIFGDIDNNGHTLTLESDEQMLEMFGRISGSGGLVVSNWGVVRLSGANTFTGPTVVHDPTILEIANPMALGTTNGGTRIEPSAMLVLATGGNFEEPLRLLGELSATSARYVGPIEAGGGRISGGEIEITSVISGDSLTIHGGTIKLWGASVYSGQLHLNGGTLVVNGEAGDISLNGGTLQGLGRVGLITSARGFSTIAPGIGLSDAGALSVSNTTLNGHARLYMQLNGLANHDVLRVNGTVDLDNAQLAIWAGYPAAIGESFVIIDNDGTDAVEESFLYLMEGMTLSTLNPAFGWQKLQITYHGGDGNDVVLTAVPDGPEVRLWDGGGADARWTTAANWVGDIAPEPGDALGFPTAASRKVNQNDFPADTSFDFIAFAGDGYDISGESIQLERGIVSTAVDTPPLAFLPNRLSLPIRLTGSQTFAASGISAQAGLVVLRRVDIGGYELTLAGAGTLSVSGEISGTGSIVKRDAGTVILSGSNTYSGLLNIVEGTIRITNPEALGATLQPTIVAIGATLAATGPHAFAEPIILGGSLTCEPDGRWTGTIDTVSSNAMLSGVFEGVISGPGGIRVEGSALTLADNNTYTGATLNNFGTLTVLGSQPQSPVTQLAGTLNGSGEAGAVTALGGTVLGGAYQPNTPDLVLTTGDLLLRAPARLQANVYSWVSNHSRIRVMGTVTLDQPEFRLNTIYLRPALDEPMTIIENDGNDPVTGTFAGLPEGWLGRLGTNGIYRITYAGGDGNDVVIARTIAEAATILSLTRIGESMQIKARGTPRGNYDLESATNLIPVISWVRESSSSAGTDGFLYLYDFPAPTNRMRFYRIRSRDF